MPSSSFRQKRTFYVREKEQKRKKFMSNSEMKNDFVMIYEEAIHGIL